MFCSFLFVQNILFMFCSFRFLQNILFMFGSFRFVHFGPSWTVSDRFWTVSDGSFSGQFQFFSKRFGSFSWRQKFFGRQHIFLTSRKVFGRQKSFWRPKSFWRQKNFWCQVSDRFWTVSDGSFLDQFQLFSKRFGSFSWRQKTFGRQHIFWRHENFFDVQIIFDVKTFFDVKFRIVFGPVPILFKPFSVALELFRKNLFLILKLQISIGRGWFPNRSGPSPGQLKFEIQQKIEQKETNKKRRCRHCLLVSRFCELPKTLATRSFTNLFTFRFVYLSFNRLVSLSFHFSFRFVSFRFVSVKDRRNETKRNEM